ncbi:snapalysin family zinc-dependent metalloprotease [Micromonospora profundi]|uniref:Extracellular small neutral protease n=1 Tax=Micromonospora profundi TaxID=1420889 RepID=A0AAJ6KZI2_9ACTN|nr:MULTISPECIES: snapalysin family zinc-dependent metalloprotease [Micromonospora]KOX14774.1 peptidase M7 [Micromonospora sp. NRRL B-16802]NJC15448.1 snapalysin [Micromonospora profundi]WLS46949.1 snapalysin family zinc-dependent metalloprotease [Micromonospora profundi]
MTSRLKRLAVASLATALATLGITVANPSPASAAMTICYNTSQAGSYASVANQAASIWNNATVNLTLSANCGSNLRIYRITGGGSYAVRTSLGNGRVYIDTQQAAQYSVLRIMTHEIGHILGLPDNYNGNCSLLMSGGSAGTSCTNAYPSSAEANRVSNLFAGTFAATERSADRAGADVFQDSWPSMLTSVS